MSEKASWRHHYLPRFYLRYWGGDGELLRRYRIKHGKFENRERSTKSVGYEPHLYDGGSEVPPLETQVMSPLDNVFGSAYHEVLSDFTNLRPGAIRETFHRFIYTVQARHPKIMKSAYNFTNSEMEKLALASGIGADEMKQVFAGTSLENRRAFTAAMIVSLDPQYKAFGSMPQEIFRSTNEGGFITGDYPVIAKPRFFDPGAFYLFPLSPRHCWIAASKTQILDSWRRMSPAKRERFANFLVAAHSKEVYDVDERHSEDIKGWIDLKRRDVARYNEITMDLTFQDTSLTEIQREAIRRNALR